MTLCFTLAGPLSCTNHWSKTIQFSQHLLTVPLPLIPGHPLCPYSALLHAFKLVPATLSGPAFALPAPSSRGLIPFTCAKFDGLLKSVASTAGLDPSHISGHSLRSGGATLAFQANIPEEFIKRLGDWRSKAFKSYIHIPIKIRMHAIHKLASFVWLLVYLFMFSFSWYGLGHSSLGQLFVFNKSLEGPVFLSLSSTPYLLLLYLPLELMHKITVVVKLSLTKISYPTYICIRKTYIYNP